MNQSLAAKLFKLKTIASRSSATRRRLHSKAAESVTYKKNGRKSLPYFPKSDKKSPKILIYRSRALRYVHIKTTTFCNYTCLYIYRDGEETGKLLPCSPFFYNTWPFQFIFSSHQSIIFHDALRSRPNPLSS